VRPNRRSIVPIIAETVASTTISLPAWRRRYSRWGGSVSLIRLFVDARSELPRKGGWVWSFVRIDQTCLRRGGGFALVSLPLFQGARLRWRRRWNWGGSQIAANLAEDANSPRRFRADRFI
jgi:hypothetical protein